MIRIAHRIARLAPACVRLAGSLALMVIFAATAAAQTWTATSPPPHDLGYHTATLLQDGRVLFVTIWGAPLLFDPRSGTWSDTVGAPADLSERGQPTAVMLRDGRVLVSGGYLNGIGYTATSYLFDPRTNGWTPTAPLLTARTAAAAVLLSDGRVLVTGGSNGVPTVAAEIYDPAADTWTSAAPMLLPRSGHATVRLLDGRILICGPDTGAELYDPAANTFTATGSMSTYRRNIAALLLPDGHVLVAGHNQPPGSATTELYDPATGMWTPAASLADPVTGVSLSLLPDSRVLLTGAPLSGTSSPTQIYDPGTNTWTPGPATIGERTQHSATVLADGRILLAGGQMSADSAEIFEMGEALAVSAAPIPGDRAWAGSVTLANGRVLVIGGMPLNANARADGGIYDPDTNTWQPVPAMSRARLLPNTALLRDGRVLVFGGGADGAIASAIAEAEIYKPDTNTWESVAPMSVARIQPASTVLSNGWVLVFGGGTGSGEATTSVEIYVPEVDRWLAMASMPAPRFGLSAVRLPDDRVLVAGGAAAGGQDGRPDAWIFDYKTNAWSHIAPMPHGRTAVQGALLPDGRVIVVSDTLAGGLEPTMADIYDPSTNTWISATFEGPARTGHNLVTLPNGDVAIVGGRYSRYLGDNTIDVFNPATNTWHTVGALSNGRLYSTSAVLPDGRILDVGGFDGLLGTLDVAEIVTISRGNDASRQPSLDPTGALANGASHAFTGAGFAGPFAAAGSSYASSSATNYPLMSYRSLTTNDVRFLPVSQWSDTNVTVDVPGGQPLGPAVVTEMTNGLHSAPRLTTITSAASSTSVFNASVPYRFNAQGRTLLARMSAFTPDDDGRVLFYITGAGGVPLIPASMSGPIVNAIASTPALIPAAMPVGTYGLTAIYTGDLTHAPSVSTGTFVVTPRDTQLTIMPDATSITAGGKVRVTANVATVPAGETVSNGTVTITAGVQTCTITSTPYGYCDLTLTQAGNITITGNYAASTPSFNPSTATTIVTVTEPDPEPPQPTSREYFLAEGVSNSFFASYILIANPNAAEATITLTYVSESGQTATESRTLAPFSRTTIATGDGTVATSHGPSFATRVTSTTGLPLVVERSTFFDGSLHAGDLSSAHEGGSSAWIFAEGANGYFHTYLTLGNFGDQQADVTVRYLPEGGARFDRQYVIAPHSRMTIDTRAESALAADAFSMLVASNVPIAADRVQYFGSPFIGAHADSGANNLSADWYFAEGAGGTAFNTYLLLGNVFPIDTSVTVTYHTEAGEAITKTYAVRAEGRRSIDVEAEDPRLATGSFWIEVHADHPIVAERAMYLSNGGGWTDATATTGAHAPALRWGLADGAVGAPLGYRTYVLIANPNNQAADITVQYLRESGAPVSHTYSVPAQGRLTLDVSAEEPSIAGTSFSTIVTSATQPIIVEHSLYWTLGTPNFIGAMNTMGAPLPVPVP